jgi:hypothetical protein
MPLLSQLSNNIAHRYNFITHYNIKTQGDELRFEEVNEITNTKQPQSPPCTEGM